MVSVDWLILALTVLLKISSSTNRLKFPTKKSRIYPYPLVLFARRQSNTVISEETDPLPDTSSLYPLDSYQKPYIKARITKMLGESKNKGLPDELQNSISRDVEIFRTTFSADSLAKVGPCTFPPQRMQKKFVYVCVTTIGNSMRSWLPSSPSSSPPVLITSTRQPLGYVRHCSSWRKELLCFDLRSISIPLKVSCWKISFPCRI